MEKECEHELYYNYEEYINEDEIIVEAKCDLCNAKFKGIIKRTWITN